MWNLFAQIIIDDMLKELGPDFGVEIYWHVDGQLHRGARPSAAAVPVRQIVLLLAGDITVTSSSEEGLRLATAALDRAARRWGMELSAEKTKVLAFRRPTRPPTTRAAANAEAARAAEERATTLEAERATLAAAIATARSAARTAFLAAHASAPGRVTRAAAAAAAAAHNAGATAAADAAGAKAGAAEKRRVTTLRKTAATAARAATETAALAAGPLVELDGTALATPASAKYLGSVFSIDGAMDNEISARLAAAQGAAVRLRHSVWHQRRLGATTKLRFYRGLVLTVLLYGGESWPVTVLNLQRLEVFHQRRLREILRVKWADCVSNEEVLRRAGMPSIEVMLRKTRLSWLGHIARMADERTVKRLLFGQIDGPRPVGGTLTTLRRTFKADVLVLQGGVPNGVAWYDAAQDRARWRDMVARATWDNREAAATATGGGGGDADAG
jgi:hypothetical protein